MTDILNRIDDTLEDWNGSADSARWAGGPEESEWDEVRLGQAAEVIIRPQIQAFQDAIGRSVEILDGISDEALELGRITPFSALEWQHALSAIGHRDDWPQLKRYARRVGYGPSELVDLAMRIDATREQP